MEAAFIVGDYDGVISQASGLSDERSRSLLARSLIITNQEQMANEVMANGMDPTLEHALRVYSKALKGHDRQGILQEAKNVSENRQESRHEIAVVLSRVYALSGDIRSAYRLAAQTPTLEA